MNNHLIFRTVACAAFFFALFAMPVPAICQQSEFQLAPLFTDNMVLQQKSLVPFWGQGSAGSTIRVQTSWGKGASVQVDSTGTWMLKVQTPKAGGPYTVAVGYDDTILTLKNVMIGEVWLCSGQSNMEMPLAGWPPGAAVLYSQDVIAHSSNPDLRMFTVRRAFSAKPEFSCEGKWIESSPTTSKDFSATAYFFGEKLYEAMHVPIGLIHSSWGGTRIESWMSSEFLAKLPGYDSTLQKVRECISGQQQLMEWLHKYPTVDMNARTGEDRWKELTFKDEQCPSRSYDDSDWHAMNLPTLWERTEVGSFDGVVWFRRLVKIPPDWVHKNLLLELGPIDDIDVTFVNGARVGGHEVEGQWNVDRKYAVPGTVVDTTILQIAVRVIDFGGGGGIYGNPKSMTLHPEAGEESISLGGEWKYMPVADYYGNTLYVFGPSGNQYISRPRLPIDLSADTPTSLYNGMIAPLIPFAIRGSIWYQGEANVGNPEEYKRLFPLLIEGWRHDFNVGQFPFYFVQIAPFDYGKDTPSELLREAQTATLAVPNTGMAVTLDIGNSTNIHPANKQAVGERLARWALAKVYGKNVAFSGPIYRSFKRVKGGIELSFEDVDKGLVLVGAMNGNGFQIAGSDRVFKHAHVEVRGSKLMVMRPEVPNPESVRYAFSNTPEATLFNTDGLPAPSFRTDDWK